MLRYRRVGNCTITREFQKMTNVKLNRDILLQSLRGYEEANRFIEAERRARLAQMTDDEARTLFDGLNQGIEELNAEEKTRLAAFRLEHHLIVRQAMLRLAQAKGYEPTF